MEDLELAPEQAGLTRVPLRVVQGGDVAENAARFRALLDGRAPEADEQIVLLNTAALLLAAGKAGDLREGVATAREALRSGKAAEVLKRYVEASND
jgi:anthranilate phosphoribosyltransferase